MAEIVTEPALRPYKVGAQSAPYLPSEKLRQAVDLTVFLRKRPLLVKGEPGSGKTRLAQAVADDLDYAFYFWPVKSTSRARDGAYTYDAVRRLQDAQLARVDEAARARVADPYNYITPGPLGAAFQSERPAVLLIDEIDKADIDFPNDLLLELDEHYYVIEELPAKDERRVVRAKHIPVVFVTSNDEKDLPDAFLRRCLFHYIEPLSHDHLVAIVQAHNASEHPPSPILVEAAVTRFEKLRERMKQDASRTGKTVSTSELLDWVQVLRNYPEDTILAQLGGQLPFPEVLLKKWEDHLRYLQAPATP